MILKIVCEHRTDCRDEPVNRRPINATERINQTNDSPISSSRNEIAKRNTTGKGDKENEIFALETIIESTERPPEHGQALALMVSEIDYVFEPGATAQTRNGRPTGIQLNIATMARLSAPSLGPESVAVAITT